MLAQYDEATELSKITVRENAGYVIVFTREDLDNMQANTLNDVLNILRNFNLQRSRMGETQIIKAGAGSFSISPVKVFINSHELNSVTFGNPIVKYGSMNLYYIDHIEVYQAGNSVSFGNESSGMVIKLYTKDPLRENGTFGQFSVDNRLSSRVNIIDAGTIGDKYSYLINLDINKREVKDENINGYKLQRDSLKTQFFSQFSKKDDYRFEIGYTRDSGDPYTVFSLTPKENQKQLGYDLYINGVKEFGSNTILNISTSLEKIKIDYSDYANVKFTNGVSAQKINVAFFVIRIINICISYISAN
jgi:iron complex outermembrane receptor protein